MKKIKLLLVDDHSLIRKGLRLLLELNLKITSIDEADSCNMLMRRLKEKEYTHLILDLALSDGSVLEILPNIVALYPGLPIMIFSMQPKTVYQGALERYGIKHFLSKTASEDTTLAAVRKFLEGAKPTPVTETAPPFEELTPRELEVLHYLLQGAKTSEIAANLNLKMNTVSTLKKRIFEKTDTENLKQLWDLAAIFNYKG